MELPPLAHACLKRVKVVSNLVLTWLIPQESRDQIGHHFARSASQPVEIAGGIPGAEVRTCGANVRERCVLARVTNGLGVTFRGIGQKHGVLSGPRVWISAIAVRATVTARRSWLRITIGAARWRSRGPRPCQRSGICGRRGPAPCLSANLSLCLLHLSGCNQRARIGKRDFQGPANGRNDCCGYDALQRGL